MQTTWSQILETRVWAGAFAAIPFFAIAFVLFRLAGEKPNQSARDRFWRPIAALGELSSSLGVVAAVTVAAHYFVKGEDASVQESLAQVTSKRQGSAFVVGLTACGPSMPTGASFVELSAMSQLCAIGRAFSQATAPPLDDAVGALIRMGPLPMDVRSILSPQAQELAGRLQSEIDASRRLHLTRLQARIRPGESDCVVVAIAASVLFGAALKFGRAASEWRHRRDEG